MRASLKSRLLQVFGHLDDSVLFMTGSQPAYQGCGRAGLPARAFRVLNYISPLRWSLNEMVWAAYSDANYEGTASCTPTANLSGVADEALPLAAGAGRELPSIFLLTSQGSSAGAARGSRSSRACPPRSPRSRLRSSDTLGRDVGILLAIVFACKVG